MRRSDNLLPLPFALRSSLVRRCLATARFFVPVRSRASVRSGLEVVQGVPLHLCITRGDSRSSQVPGDPPVNLLCSSTPARVSTSPLRCLRSACCLTYGIGRLQRDVFGAQQQGPFTPCVRFTASVALAAQHSVPGWWLAFAGAGLTTSKDPFEGFCRLRSSTSSTPRLCLAHR
jgi:hypothetical protein